MATEHINQPIESMKTVTKLFLKISTWLKFQGLSIYHHSLDIAMHVLQIMV